MISGCPGAAGIRGTPILSVKTCPECGNEIEIFSNEITTSCTNCGFVAYNDTQSCLEWCQYARECVGDALYEQFMSRPKKKAGEEEAPSEKASAPNPGETGQAPVQEGLNPTQKGSDR